MDRTQSDTRDHPSARTRALEDGRVLRRIANGKCGGRNCVRGHDRLRPQLNPPFLVNPWESAAAAFLTLDSTPRLGALYQGDAVDRPRGPVRLLARGVDGDRGAAPGPADGPHLSAPSSSAEELIAAIGLETRNGHSG